METFDPTDTQSHDSAREDKAQRAKLARDTDESDFKWLMSSKRGRRVVWRLLDRAGIFRSSFSTNAMAMAFTEGQKNEGIRLLGQIHTLCPELYPVMTKEALHDNRTTD
jgi:hypothetical protein